MEAAYKGVRVVENGRNLNHQAKARPGSRPSGEPLPESVLSA